MNGGFSVGAWCWHSRQAPPCRVVDHQDVWGEVAYRVWLPGRDAVVCARAQHLGDLSAVCPTVEQILYTAATAKLLDALEDNLLLAPIQSSVVPLPHQLYALNRVMSRDHIRYLLADLPVFVTDDGHTFVPTAKRIWDLLLTENVTPARRRSGRRAAGRAGAVSALPRGGTAAVVCAARGASCR